VDTVSGKVCGQRPSHYWSACTHWRGLSGGIVSAVLARIDFNVISNEEVAPRCDNHKDGQNNKYHPTPPIKPIGLASSIGELRITFELSAVRIDEFKFHTVVRVPNAVAMRGQQGGLSGTAQRTAGSIMFNLYTNPQEDDAVGARHIPMGVPLFDEMNRYGEVIRKFRSEPHVAITSVPLSHGIQAMRP
jgi:hypothetical protein